MCARPSPLFPTSLPPAPHRRCRRRREPSVRTISTSLICVVVVVILPLSSRAVVFPAFISASA